MTWINIKESMQLYCEIFFSGIERWRHYNNHELLRNRIELLGNICDLLFKGVHGDTIEIYDIEATNEQFLFPEYTSAVGTVIIENGDNLAFQYSKNLVPQEVFSNVGLFFQEFILKPLAGFSPRHYENANKMIRESLLHCFKKIMQLSEQSGMAKLTKTIRDHSGIQSLYYMNLVDINNLSCGKYGSLYAYLINTRNLASPSTGAFMKEFPKFMDRNNSTTIPTRTPTTTTTPATNATINNIDNNVTILHNYTNNNTTSSTTITPVPVSASASDSTIITQTTSIQQPQVQTTVIQSSSSSSSSSSEVPLISKPVMSLIENKVTNHMTDTTSIISSTNTMNTSNHVPSSTTTTTTKTTLPSTNQNISEIKQSTLNVSVKDTIQQSGTNATKVQAITSSNGTHINKTNNNIHPPITTTSSTTTATDVTNHTAKVTPSHSIPSSTTTTTTTTTTTQSAIHTKNEPSSRATPTKLSINASEVHTPTAATITATATATTDSKKVDEPIHSTTLSHVASTKKVTKDNVTVTNSSSSVSDNTSKNTTDKDIDDHHTKDSKKATTSTQHNNTSSFKSEHTNIHETTNTTLSEIHETTATSVEKIHVPTMATEIHESQQPNKEEVIKDTPKKKRTLSITELSYESSPADMTIVADIPTTSTIEVQVTTSSTAVADDDMNIEDTMSKSTRTSTTAGGKRGRTSTTTTKTSTTTAAAIESSPVSSTKMSHRLLSNTSEIHETPKTTTEKSKKAKIETVETSTSVSSTPTKKKDTTKAIETSPAVTKEPEWISKGHESIGSKVVNYFTINVGKKKSSVPFVGTVKKYLPPSKPHLKDFLYHVVWEDGDECDYDFREYAKGVKEYEEHSKKKK